MSTPVSERTRTRKRATVTVDWSRTAAPKKTTHVPAPRGTVTVPAQRSTQPAGAAKAYARRDERSRRLVGGPRRAVATGGRAQFVLLIMALFATGLVLTLWLSTAAAADSYRLQAARTAARDLTEQSERLHREVAAMAAPPALAQRATDLGMVPSKDPARLVVAPDGAVTVVGKPAAAVAAAVPNPAPPAPPAVQNPAPPAGQDPAAAAGQNPAPPAGQDPAPPAGQNAAAGAAQNSPTPTEDGNTQVEDPAPAGQAPDAAGTAG